MCMHCASRQAFFDASCPHIVLGQHMHCASRQAFIDGSCPHIVFGQHMHKRFSFVLAALSLQLSSKSGQHMHTRFSFVLAALSLQLSSKSGQHMHTRFSLVLAALSLQLSSKSNGVRQPWACQGSSGASWQQSRPQSAPVKRSLRC
jgi:hypothetical protein